MEEPGEDPSSAYRHRGHPCWVLMGVSHRDPSATGEVKAFPSEYSVQDTRKHHKYPGPHCLCKSDVCRTPGSITSLFIECPSSQPQLSLQSSAAPREEPIPGRGSRCTTDTVLMLLETGRMSGSSPSQAVYYLPCACSSRLLGEGFQGVTHRCDLSPGLCTKHKGERCLN